MPVVLLDPPYLSVFNPLHLTVFGPRQSVLAIAVPEAFKNSFKNKYCNTVGKCTGLKPASENEQGLDQL